MKAIQALLASIFVMGGVIYLYFFTSFGRSETMTSILRVSDDLVITSDFAISFIYALLFFIAVVACIKSVWRLIA